MNISKLRPALFAIGLVAAGATQAALVTSEGSLGTPTEISLGSLGSGFISQAPAGPFSLPDGASYSYTAGQSGLYYDYCGWGLGTNGQWCQGSLGVNQSGTLHFSFATAQEGVGLFMNYAPADGAVYISALDASNHVIESYQIDAAAPISTPAGTNEGAFRGIKLDSPSIYGFELTGESASSPIAAMLAITSAVPEPDTYALMACGLAGVGFVARRRRSRG